MKPPTDLRVKLIVSPDALIRRLRETPDRRYGLCMFVPSLLAVSVNRQLNTAFSDSGDNLSVQLGTGPLDYKVRYLGGNYMAASLDHAVGAVNAFSRFPKAVLLVTEALVTASREVPAIAIVKGDEVSLLQDEVYSYFSFAEKNLSLYRIEQPNEELDISFGFDLTIKGLILRGSHASSLMMIPPWEAIFRLLSDSPAEIFRFSKDPRAFEEFIAETYRREGYDVELTPRSNDGGKDVVATRHGFGAIKIIDQAKAFSRGKRVKAKDVRELYGVLAMDGAASKAVLTTTSEFAPGIESEFSNYVPTRLELRSGQNLISWLKSVQNKN